LGQARKAIVLGIGGGGDVAGALACGRLCEQFGVEIVLGGVAWERIPIDPYPGPRPMEEIVNARPLAAHVALAGPDAQTPDGALFAEAGMASYLEQDTLLVDVHGGPRAVASSLALAARTLDADLVLGVDVGGDVLANGSEPGLASPLCDSVMLSALAHLEHGGVKTLGAVFGPCCDGELTIDELLGRIAVLAAAGSLVGVAGMAKEVADELEEVVRQVPTEASAQAIRCARGEIGVTTIRRGRREVVLSPLGALTFYFEPTGTVANAAPLAKEVAEASSLEEANDLLHALGVKSELDYERKMLEA
jgi:hypothetical protein